MTCFYDNSQKGNMKSDRLDNQKKRKKFETLYHLPVTVNVKQCNLSREVNTSAIFFRLPDALETKKFACLRKKYLQCALCQESPIP